MANKRFWDVIKSGDFFVIDTETTGLGDDAEVCQIAVVDNNGRTVLDTYVRPVAPIPAEATHVHGITNEMVEKAPGWAEIHVFLGAVLRQKPLLVYNAAYDLRIMSSSSRKAGVHDIGKDIADVGCVMLAYAEFWGDWNDFRGSYRWQKLSDAARQCGVGVENAHDALGDCLMTLGVVKHMANVANAETHDRYGDKS